MSDLKLVHEISQRPAEAAVLCHLYTNYMIHTTELQVDSFAKVSSVALQAVVME